MILSTDNSCFQMRDGHIGQIDILIFLPTRSREVVILVRNKPPGRYPDRSTVARNRPQASNCAMASSVPAVLLDNDAPRSCGMH